MELLAKWMELIDQHKKLIIDLNTKDQLFKKGIDRDGNSLRPKYKKQTIKRYKKSRSTPDLKVSGSYYKSYKVTTGKKAEIEGTAKTSRGFDLADHLRNSYGKIEGLTKDNEDEVAGKLIPALLEWTDQKIMKKINEL